MIALLVMTGDLSPKGTRFSTIRFVGTKEKSSAALQLVFLLLRSSFP
jgi:hypothetical protein